jgi:hypothetical protein
MTIIPEVWHRQLFIRPPLFCHLKDGYDVDISVLQAFSYEATVLSTAM